MSRCKNLVRIDSVTFPQKSKLEIRAGFLRIERLSQHFMAEHKMHCILAAELSKDWSKLYANTSFVCPHTICTLRSHEGCLRI